MTTEAGEPAVDDVATEARLMTEAVEPVINDVATEAKVVMETMVATKVVVDGVEGLVAIESKNGKTRKGTDGVDQLILRYTALTKDDLSDLKASIWDLSREQHEQ